MDITISLHHPSDSSNILGAILQLDDHFICGLSYEWQEEGEEP